MVILIDVLVENYIMAECLNYMNLKYIYSRPTMLETVGDIKTCNIWDCLWRAWKLPYTCTISNGPCFTANSMIICYFEYKCSD